MCEMGNNPGLSLMRWKQHHTVMCTQLTLVFENCGIVTSQNILLTLRSLTNRTKTYLHESMGLQMECHSGVAIDHTVEILHQL